MTPPTPLSRRGAPAARKPRSSRASELLSRTSVKAVASAVASRRWSAPWRVTFTRTGPTPPSLEASWIAVITSWTVCAAVRSTPKVLPSPSVMDSDGPAVGAVTFASARPRTRSTGSAPLRAAAPVMSAQVVPPSVVAYTCASSIA